MQLSDPSLKTCTIITLLCGAAIFIPFWMQGIVAPLNEACWGPIAEARLREMFALRYQTWAVSLVATGLCIAVICKLAPNRLQNATLIGLFVVWKLATLFHDSFGSPMCFEPYENDSPFWAEPLGTGLAFWLQPLAFSALTLALILVGLWTWLRFARMVYENRGN